MAYYENIPKIVYEGASSKNPFSFRFYNPDEMIGGKTMREQLRFAMSYWHTMCAEGTDMFGVGTIAKNYGATDPMEIARRTAAASALPPAIPAWAGMAFRRAIRRPAGSSPAASK